MAESAWAVFLRLHEMEDVWNLTVEKRSQRDSLCQ